MSTTPITITICRHAVDRRLARCLLCDPDTRGGDYWDGFRRGEEDAKARIRAAVEGLEEAVHLHDVEFGPHLHRGAVLAAIDGEQT